MGQPLALTAVPKDGRVARHMGLFEVKMPSESRERWEEDKVLATLPAGEVFSPLAAGAARS